MNFINEIILEVIRMVLANTKETVRMKSYNHKTKRWEYFLIKHIDSGRIDIHFHAKVKYEYYHIPYLEEFEITDVQYFPHEVNFDKRDTEDHLCVFSRNGYDVAFLSEKGLIVTDRLHQFTKGELLEILTQNLFQGCKGLEYVKAVSGE